MKTSCINCKTAYEAYVLVKDKEWNERLSKYVSYLTELQKSLPVPLQYKAEEPGTDAQLNAYGRWSLDGGR